MPIKFACPSCQTVLTVDEKLAGKSGKCKCGSAIRIPSLASAGVAQQGSSSPALASVFDDLTESDFNRQSPYKVVYEPPKNSGDAKVLRRFEDQIEGEIATKPGQLTGVLIFFAVMNILSGIGALVLVGILIASRGFVDQLAAQFPLARLGYAVILAICSVAMLMSLTAGIGVLLKQWWGWLCMAITYTSSAIDRLGDLVLTIMSGFEQMAFFKAFISFIIGVLIASYMYKDDTLRVFRIKNGTLKVVAAVGAVLLIGGLYGALFALGKSAPPSP
ncbi:MAG: hypothetical protein KDB03_14645 [Planctomycetales bacterium]|nr:hypothetical protein [Planctomycetales bacterium]